MLNNKYISWKDLIDWDEEEVFCRDCGGPIIWKWEEREGNQKELVGYCKICGSTYTEK